MITQGKGIAILDAGYSFGSGNLGTYGLNSNTSANGFLKQLHTRREATVFNHSAPKYFQKLKNKRVGLDENCDSTDDEGSLITKESIPLPPFKDLYPRAPLVQVTQSFGSQCIPLSVVGMVFNYTGNHLLHFIATNFGRRIFFPCHTVSSVQLLPSGEILTSAIRKEVEIKQTEKGIQVTVKGESPVQFRSNAVILN